MDELIKRISNLNYNTISLLKKIHLIHNEFSF
jgi:hypothetical protein